MKRYLLIAAAALGLYASASAADPVSDVQIILTENLQPTTVVLIEGLADTGVVLIETTNAVQTSAAFGNTVAGTGSALVAGTEDLGALGLGLQLGNLALQQNLSPLLEFLDDPSEETLDALFKIEDLGRISNNIPESLEAGWEGSSFAFNTGIQDALVQGLQGNLVDSAIIPTNPALLHSTLFGLTAGSEELFRLTNYDVDGANFAGSVGVLSLVLNGALAGQLEPLEEALLPLFEELEPATTPLGAGIEAFEIPDLGL